MLVGVPKEIKTLEFRVGLAPGSVREITHRGHRVIVETGAGAGIDFTDDAYRAAGAEIVEYAEAVFAGADMIVKVKEPQPVECERLREDQVLFTYLHLAPDPRQTELLMASGAVAIAYETVTDGRGGLPLLAPMSEVAGRLSIQAGAHCLEKAQGGRGRGRRRGAGVRRGRTIGQGEGAAGARMRDAAPGAGVVHLSAPGRRSRADGVAAR